MFFVGTLLLVSFIAGNIFLTMNMSLNYENVKPKLNNIVKNELQKGGDILNIENNFNIAEIYCQNHSDYLFNETDYEFVIPCEIVLQGTDAVVDYSTNAFIEEFYYKKYDCALFDCVLEGKMAPMIFVSQHAKDYWKGKFYWMILVSLILIAIMFFLIENKMSLFTDVGGLMIISALPLLAINWIVSYIDFADILFLNSKTIFWIIFVLGIILLGTGIVLRLLGVGSPISKGDVKKIINKEIEKKR